MTTHPTLAEQIEAVEWAAQRLKEQEETWPRALRDDETEEMLRRLEAALERLRTWEFGSAIAR